MANKTKICDLDINTSYKKILSICQNPLTVIGIAARTRYSYNYASTQASILVEMGYLKKSASAGGKAFFKINEDVIEI